MSKRKNDNETGAKASQRRRRGAAAAAAAAVDADADDSVGDLELVEDLTTPGPEPLKVEAPAASPAPAAATSAAPSMSMAAPVAESKYDKKAPGDTGTGDVSAATTATSPKKAPHGPDVVTNANTRIGELVISDLELAARIAEQTAQQKAEFEAYEAKRKALEAKIAELETQKRNANTHLELIRSAVAKKDSALIKNALETDVKTLSSVSAGQHGNDRDAAKRATPFATAPSSPQNPRVVAALQGNGSAGSRPGAAKTGASAVPKPKSSPMKIKRDDDKRSYVRWMLERYPPTEWSDRTHLRLQCKGCGANPSDHRVTDCAPVPDGPRRGDGEPALWAWKCPTTALEYPEPPTL